MKSCGFDDLYAAEIHTQNESPPPPRAPEKSVQISPPFKSPPQTPPISQIETYTNTQVTTVINSHSQPSNEEVANKTTTHQLEEKIEIGSHMLPLVQERVIAKTVINLYKSEKFDEFISVGKVFDKLTERNWNLSTWTYITLGEHTRVYIKDRESQ